MNPDTILKTPAKDDGLIAPRVYSHYRQLGVMQGWGRTEMAILAALANRTVEEVGAFATLTPAETRRSMENDHFSPAVTLHLLGIQQAILEVNFGEPSTPLIPLDWLQTTK